MTQKDMPLTTGERIQKYRKNVLGISQTELAKRVELLTGDIKCTQQTIGDIENGRTRNSRLLPYIAAALEVGLEYLNPKIKELNIIQAKDANSILQDHSSHFDQQKFIKKTPSHQNIDDDYKFYEDPNIRKKQEANEKKTIVYLEKDVPIYETIDLTKDGFIITDTPTDFITRPYVVKLEENAFGIINRCRTLEPAIRIGNTILIHPRKPPKEGDFCIYINEIDNIYTIGEYLNDTPQQWTIKTYTPKQEKYLEKNIWKKCHIITAIFL